MNDLETIKPMNKDKKAMINEATKKGIAQVEEMIRESEAQAKLAYRNQLIAQYAPIFLQLKYNQGLNASEIIHLAAEFADAVIREQSK